MRISRIYLPLDQSDVQSTLSITGDKAHYIRNVLRLRVNHPLHFFIPAGIEFKAQIATINKHEVTLNEITAISQQPQSSALETTLIQGISSSDRMDYSIQKAAELGCKQLIPVLTDFCSQKIAVHKRAKKQQHWHAVAISACEQSGRVDLMQVAAIQTLAEALSAVKSAIYLEPNAGHFLAQLPPAFQHKQTIIIGPEGGFSPTEIDLFENNQYLGVQLGQRVLRTETVAPAIMGALHALFGDFKPPTE